MTEKEIFDKENEVILEIIKNGNFLIAKEGIIIGQWISQGLTEGMNGNIKNINIKTDSY